MTAEPVPTFGQSEPAAMIYAEILSNDSLSVKMTQLIQTECAKNTIRWTQTANTK